MKRLDRALQVQNFLNQYIPEVDIPLEHQDSYTLLVAVLLSAQCTDMMVNRVTPILFQKAATPQKMVQLKVAEIENIVRPCGLGPQKAKAIHALSKILLEKYNGEVPKEIHLLEQLPGVGHKTASVVMIQAFGIPAFPVDTHIHRLAHRWGLSNGKNVQQTEKDLKKLYTPASWAKLHLQIILYGRKYCPARGHIIEQCPICNWIAQSKKKKT